MVPVDRVRLVHLLRETGPDLDRRNISHKYSMVILDCLYDTFPERIKLAKDMTSKTLKNKEP